jgi:hypothetical protein
MNRAGRRALAALVLGAAGCASSASGVVGEATAPVARTVPDDRELTGVVPAGPETVLEVDLKQLRESLWSRRLLNTGSEQERAARRAALGYDEINDVDRLVFAVTESSEGPMVLTVAQGRFVAEEIGRAFTAANPGASADPWRGVSLWRAGELATALLTARTVVSGRLATVRGVIDCSLGLAADMRSAALGPVRRAMEPERSHPALLAAVTVSEAMRQRINGEFQLPEGLRQVGARLDLGEALDVALLGFLDKPAQAVAAARQMQAFLDDLRGRTLLRVFGLAALLDRAGFVAEGARVRGHLTIPASERESLAQKVGLIFETVMRARSR